MVKTGRGFNHSGRISFVGKDQSLTEQTPQFLDHCRGWPVPGRAASRCLAVVLGSRSAGLTVRQQRGGGGPYVIHAPVTEPTSENVKAIRGSPSLMVFSETPENWVLQRHFQENRGKPG